MKGVLSLLSHPPPNPPARPHACTAPAKISASTPACTARHFHVRTAARRALDIFKKREISTQKSIKLFFSFNVKHVFFFFLAGKRVPPPQTKSSNSQKTTPVLLWILLGAHRVGISGNGRTAHPGSPFSSDENATSKSTALNYGQTNKVPVLPTQASEV